ncbi:hypothetical protein JCM8547_007794 [Rhodosporidiobolus lusitaniae]
MSIDYSGLRRSAYLLQIGFCSPSSPSIDLIPAWRPDCASLLEQALAVLRDSYHHHHPGAGMSRELSLSYADQVWVFHLVVQGIRKAEEGRTVEVPPLVGADWTGAGRGAGGWWSRLVGVGRGRGRELFDFASLSSAEHRGLVAFMHEILAPDYVLLHSSTPTPVRIKPDLMDYPAVFVDSSDGYRIVRPFIEPDPVSSNTLDGPSCRAPSSSSTGGLFIRDPYSPLPPSSSRHHTAVHRPFVLRSQQEIERRTREREVEEEREEEGEGWRNRSSYWGM